MESAGFVAGAIARGCALRVFDGDTDRILARQLRAFRAHACGDEPEWHGGKTVWKRVVRARRRDRAADHFQAAVEYAPDLPVAHYNLAMIRQRENRAADAEREYKIALQTDNGSYGSGSDHTTIWECCIWGHRTIQQRQRSSTPRSS